MHFLSARQSRCGEPVPFETLPLSSIRDNPNNAREHSRKQLATLARSIRKFGFITPVVVTKRVSCYAATHAFRRPDSLKFNRSPLSGPVI